MNRCKTEIYREVELLLKKMFERLAKYLGTKRKPVYLKNGEKVSQYPSSIDELSDRVSLVEKKQQQLDKILNERCWTIEKVIIEKMSAEKLELNLDNIDVEELSGMLSIGINYGGRLIKMEPSNKSGSEKNPSGTSQKMSGKASSISEEHKKKNNQGEKDQPGKSKPQINLMFM